MGLDWCVVIQNKETKEQVDIKDTEWIGCSYIRGKQVVGLLDQYVGMCDMQNECFGEYEYDDEGNEMGPFIEDDWLLQNIYSLLNEKEIKIFDDWEVENQKEVINSIQTMYDDIQTYNNSTEKYEAKIYCWY